MTDRENVVIARVERTRVLHSSIVCALAALCALLFAASARATVITVADREFPNYDRGGTSATLIIASPVNVGGPTTATTPGRFKTAATPTDPAGPPAVLTEDPRPAAATATDRGMAATATTAGQVVSTDALRTRTPGTKTVYASSVATLDANKSTCEGTDATAALQAVLDTAPSSGTLRLILDGVARVTGLNVRGNTVIDGMAVGGVCLASGSNRAAIRNQNRSAGAVTDQNVTLKDLTIYGNRAGQAKCNGSCVRGGEYNVGLQFFGVNDLTLDGVRIYNSKNFSFHAANVKRVKVLNSRAEQPPDYEIDNHDGFHFNGPASDIVLSNTRCVRTSDDCIAINAFDPVGIFGPLVVNGAINDVTIDNTWLDNAFFGIRLMADSANPLDGVTIRNVRGVVQEYVLRFDDGAQYGGRGVGAIRKVSLDAVSVRGFSQTPQVGYGEAVRVESFVEQFSVRNFKQGAGWYADYRPVIRVLGSRTTTNPWCPSGCTGGLGDIKTLDAALEVYDPPGTDPTGGGSANAGYRIQVEGNVDRARVSIKHTRAASVPRNGGAVWVRTAGIATGVGELAVSGSVNRQLNTVALTGGKLTTLRIDGLTDIDNAGAAVFVQNTGAGISAPTLSASNVHVTGGTLTGGKDASSITRAPKQ